MPPAGIDTLVAALLMTEESGKEGLAARLGVSTSAVTRWESGKSRPRPSVEGQIRALAASRLSTREMAPSQHQLPWRAHAPAEHDTRAALLGTLRELREVFHRRGRLSSRHEALDEVSKLLFAHVVSIDTGGAGIGPSMLTRGKSAASALREFVVQAVRLHLPKSLSHEVSPSDFHLRLKESEEELAVDLVACFAKHASPLAISRAHRAGELDLINDVFGQFLVDSFNDEKELGQYLTPTEVVQFMVRLGLASLPRESMAALCSPDKVAGAGLVLDPSCGVGSFLAEAVRILYESVRKASTPAELQRWTDSMMSSVVVGIDKSERMIRLALTNLALFGASHVNIHLANSLARSGREAALMDAMAGKAQLILTNPPFGAEYSAHDASAYKLVSCWAKKAPHHVDSELLFMERYSDWLAPGGVLVAIVPDSVLTNRGLFEDLRAGLSNVLQVLSVVSLPPVTFAAAGTQTKTSVLLARKSGAKSSTAFFAICSNIGYEVAARGAHRKKLPNGQCELPNILSEAIEQSAPVLGRRIPFTSDTPRWDATYHAGLPADVRKSLADASDRQHLTVADVAELSHDRCDPRRLGAAYFNYIEISDVDPSSNRVDAKRVSTSEAPSRARRRVRAGDVLVSTVRPERKCVGVVPTHLDGAVCSTGFAVLRPTGIHPVLLCRLIQTDFATAQIMRNNVGIAYPAIEEDCLPKVVLPITRKGIEHCREKAANLQRAWEAVDTAAKQLGDAVVECDRDWQRSLG